MKLVIDDDDLEEIKPVAISTDKGVVINPTQGKRGEGTPDLVKEAVALDAIELGPTAAAMIHGVTVSSASRYADGKDVGDDETRARILSTRHEIQDVAIAKLMDTLNIIEPNELIKTKDKVMVLNSLSNLVDKIGEKNNPNGMGSVHLHLYAPAQKKETDYKVIDV